jgi:hypothetical protein
LAPLRWRWPSLLAVATRKLLLRPPRLPTLLLLLPLLLLPLLTLPLRLPTRLLRLPVLRPLLRPKLRSSNRNAQALAIRNRTDRQPRWWIRPVFSFACVCGRRSRPE